MSTPTMRVCQVTEGEDFTARIVTDRKLASLDAKIVACGEESDARVRIVTNDAQAVEFILVVGGEIDDGDESGYSDTYSDTYTD